MANLTNEQILFLLQLKGLGVAKAHRLIKELKTPINDEIDLMSLVVNNATRLKLPNYTNDDFSVAKTRVEEILIKSEQNGIQIISSYDDEYPSILKDLSVPPLLLHIKGDIKKLSEMNGVAIIGTRQPTHYGTKIGNRLGKFCGERGFNVISGLAIGCDTAGHRGCLIANGTTTAILAHGLDTIYPKENKQLAYEILDKGGLWVSEYAVGTRSFSSFFVERDRIQAGLSKAVIVVETGIKGGTMHTVSFANDAKRIVAAYQHPLEAQSEKSQGNQMLISQGLAKPLVNSNDIEEILSRISSPKKDTFTIVKNGLSIANMLKDGLKQENHRLAARKDKNSYSYFANVNHNL